MTTADLRFAKTDKGQEEIRTRAYRLNPKLRSLLVMVDGIKSVGELLKAATALGGGREALDALIQDGFIAAAPAGAPVAPEPAAVAAPAVSQPAAPIGPAALSAAKTAMRQYVKLAAGALDSRALNKLVDDVRSAADLSACLDRLCRDFEGRGNGDAAQNLRAAVEPLLARTGA